MTDRPAQSLRNHARIVPGYHYGVLGLLGVNLLYAGWRIFRAPNIDSLMGLLLAVALGGLAYYARVFALTAQDRLIRLEMRLRLREVLAEDLRVRIPELSPGQMISLRFASDAELPGLVRTVLDEKIRSRRQIKERIKDWQPDTLRV